jgi:UDP-N-acetylenolpyruvoylglucosamine reductase
VRGRQRHTRRGGTEEGCDQGFVHVRSEDSWRGETGSVIPGTVGASWFQNETAT